MPETPKHKNRLFKISEDGSHTIYVPELNENYHSSHGAITESMYVYIQKGLNYCTKESISILEIGFGTGLNAFLSLIESHKRKIHIQYKSLEKYPLQREEWENLNYPDLIQENAYKEFFNLIHEAAWDVPVKITEDFILEKNQADLRSFKSHQGVDLVYFDAFAPDVQPDLWSVEIFNKIYGVMKPGAVLTTYSVKGLVKRRLVEAGFQIEKLKGPPGKHHMLRAIK